MHNTAIITYASTYVLFFAMLCISKTKKSNRFVSAQDFTQSPRLLLLLHLAGIFLFGILPLLNQAPVEIVISLNTSAAILATLLTLIVICFILVTVPQIVLKQINSHVYETNKHPPFRPSFLISYFIIRILFITAYEIWFRSFLLNACIEVSGMLIALLFNITLYAILHSVNGKKEMLACLPFGLLLCFLCIGQGSVWPAIAIHVALTLSYEVSWIRKITTQKLQHESFNYGRSWLYR